MTSEPTAATPAASPAPSVESAASGLGMTSSLRLARGEIPSTWTKPAEAVSQLPAPAPRPAVSGVLIGAGVLACVALAVAIAPRPAHPSTAPRSIAPAPAGSAGTPAPASTPASASPPPSATPPSTTSPDDPPATPKPIAEAAPAFSPKRAGMAPEDENPGDDVKPHVAAAPPLGALSLPKGPPAAPPGAPPGAPPTVAAPAGPATTSTATSTATAATASPGAATTSDELPAHKKAKGLTQKAIVLLRDGDYANAEPNLVRAVLVDPTYADAWRHLGIARAQLGDKDGARRAYRKYVALAPNAPDAGDVKKILAAP